MSLIGRRKSPGWEKISPRVVPNIKRVSKATRKSKTIKIVNPISRRKINLNGPTHKRLIGEGILNIDGVDIRSKKSRVKIKTQKPKAQKSRGKIKTQKSKAKTKPKAQKSQPQKSKPKTKSKSKPPKPQLQPPKLQPSRLYGDVAGNIMRFLPEKVMVKVSKYKKEYPKQNLLSYPFDLSDVERCQAFTDSDFDVLIKNQNIDRQDLFECVVMRGLTDKIKILLKDPKVDPRFLDVVTFYTMGHRWNFYYVFTKKYVASFRLHHDNQMTWDMIKKFSGKEIRSLWFNIFDELKLGKPLENNLPLSEFNFLENILKKDVPVYDDGYDLGTGISYHGVSFYEYDPRRLELLEEEYKKEQKAIIRVD